MCRRCPEPDTVSPTEDAVRATPRDLEPSNVLIKRTELGYTTKLIDFDSSYIVGTPPPPEHIVGTMTHYSPELVRYIQGAAHPAELTQASDIFALGLIYTEYLTGSLPPFHPSHPQAALAVLHGEPLRVATDRVPEGVRSLVERMMLLDPAARPTVAEVHSTLMGIRTTRSTPGRFPSPLGRRFPCAPPRPRRQRRRQWFHPRGGSCAARASASPARRPQPPRPQPTLPPTCRRPRPPQRVVAAALDCSAGWSPASTSGARDDRSHPGVAVRSLRDRQ